MMRATDQMAKVCREHQFFRYVAGMTQSRGPSRDTISISDSLSRLEFIMRVESAYGVELDESEVNACRTIREFAALVTAASK